MHFKRIKNLREDHDFTQQYVATYLNIHRVVYSRYENGVREIPVSCLINLSKLYNVSVDYLVEGGTDGDKIFLKNKSGK
ncbi:MAG: helix-turn-helix transcriptional regulator [Bacilli bacterium]|nr:helix-turn-helix transcriptional regulator [Bacilli bacterium]